MKITKVEIYPLTKLRYQRPFKISRGYVGGPEMKWGFHVMMKITTNEGIVGFGEARPNNPHQHETTWSVTEALRNFYGPLLIGRDPFDIENLMLDFEAYLPENYHARTVVDFALHDIMGKATNQPVYNLIGGKVHDRVYIKIPVSQGSTSEMIKESERIIEQTGCKYLKIKIGQPERIAQDIANVKGIREALGPEIKLQVDANAGYKFLKDALYILRRRRSTTCL
jgi:L-alanine-DL-glutamate epimerase-like enolase superfamily enzyme